MPSIAQAIEEPVFGKKRRRDEVGLNDSQMLRGSESYSNHHHNHNHSLADTPYSFDSQLTAGNESGSLRRRIITPKPLTPIPNSGANKRQRIVIPSPFLHTPTDNTQDSYFALSNNSTNPHYSQCSTQYATYSTTPLESSGVTSPTETVRKLDLSPCHICHRKPTSKHELEAFADCEGCRKRTCWICIRKCDGWGPLELEDSESRFHQDIDVTFSLEDELGGKENGEIGRRKEAIGSGGRGMMGSETSDTLRMDGVTEHRGMVCSRCCVERGSEGDVWCLGCLKALQ